MNNIKNVKKTYGDWVKLRENNPEEYNQVVKIIQNERKVNKASKAKKVTEEKQRRENARLKKLNLAN